MVVTNKDINQFVPLHKLVNIFVFRYQISLIFYIKMSKAAASLSSLPGWFDIHLATNVKDKFSCEIANVFLKIHTHHRNLLHQVDN